MVGYRFIEDRDKVRVSEINRYDQSSYKTEISVIWRLSLTVLFSDYSGQAHCLQNIVPQLVRCLTSDQTSNYLNTST